MARGRQTQAPTQPIPRTVQCGAAGDAGFCNLYGTPRLEFSLLCSLPSGHDGNVHECRVPVRVKATTNAAGAKTRIVTDQVSVVVQWEVKQ
jgi:hypothetical protein